MKPIRLILLNLLVGCLLIGCKPAVPIGAPTLVDETANAFKAALIVPTTISDAASGQSLYDSLVAVQQQLGDTNFLFAYAENKITTDEQSAAIRDYASQGYKLIILYDPQSGEMLKSIAPEFPDVSFVWCPTSDTLAQPNVFAIDPRAEEGGYVNGLMAAMLTKSNIIAALGPTESGDAKLYIDGFAAGAPAANPSIQVLQAYTSDATDKDKASSQASQMITQGADALTGISAMSAGALTAAQQNNLPWWATQTDQTALASSSVVASQVYHWEVAFLPIIQKIQGGQLGTEIFTLTLANGGEIIVYNPAYPLPANIRAAADQAIADITSGKLKPLGN